MNVWQLIETLTKMDIPEDAKVVMVHDLIGDEDELEIGMITYDPKKNIVYLTESRDW